MSLGNKLLRFLPLTFKKAVPRQLIDLGGYVTLPSGFYPTNPSIVKHGDTFLICVRGVNYVADRLLRARITSGDRYDTINRFFLFDSNFCFQCGLPDLDDAFRNIEDVRLFNYRDRVLAIGNRFEIQERGRRVNTMVLLDFDKHLRGGTLQDIASPYGFRREKNWSPFVHSDELFFIYSYDPPVLLRYSFDTASVTFADSLYSRYRPNSFRFLIGGSSPGVRTSHGYVFIAHRRKASLSKGRMIYLSRLYWLDESFTSMVGGSYFFINSPTIQFVNGLLIDDEFVYLSYGQMDHAAHLALFERSTFLNTMLPHSAVSLVESDGIA